MTKLFAYAVAKPLGDRLVVTDGAYDRTQQRWAGGLGAKATATATYYTSHTYTNPGGVSDGDDRYSVPD